MPTPVALFATVGHSRLACDRYRYQCAHPAPIPAIASGTPARRVCRLSRGRRGSHDRIEDYGVEYAIKAKGQPEPSMPPTIAADERRVGRLYLLRQER